MGVVMKINATVSSSKVEIDKSGQRGQCTEGQIRGP